MNLTKRKRQVLFLLAEAGGELLTVEQLQRAASKQWGQAKWRFGRSLRELVDVYYVKRVGERYSITNMGMRKLGRDPDA